MGTCSQCQQEGHATVACPYKNYLKRCNFCGQVGHIEKMCTERRKQAAARHAQWVARQKQGSVVKCAADDADAKSISSVSSISTAATKTTPTFVLTEQETKDA